MKYTARLGLACAILAFVAQAVVAWSIPGHMATGSIAYRVLKQESPKTIAKAIKLIKVNPYYNEKWKALIEDLDDDDDVDEFLFMQACRWADDARDDLRFYPHGSFKESIHFINQPFKPDNQPAGVMSHPAFEINITRAFPELVKQVKTDTDKKERAVALCWLMHLTGDAHQPLHTVSLYNETHHTLKDDGRFVGDRGGTWFYVKKSATAKTVYGLHGLWDGFITDESKYAENKKDVLKLLAKIDLLDKANQPISTAAASKELGHDLANIDIETWVKESFELAKTKVYFHNGQMLKGGTKKNNAELLPAGYLADSAPIAKRRGVEAGYRIAAVLRDALANEK
jgi:hypothetical protein